MAEIQNGRHKTAEIQNSKDTKRQRYKTAESQNGSACFSQPALSASKQDLNTQVVSSSFQQTTQNSTCHNHPREPSKTKTAIEKNGGYNGRTSVSSPSNSNMFSMSMKACWIILGKTRHSNQPSLNRKHSATRTIHTRNQKNTTSQVK